MHRIEGSISDLVKTLALPCKKMKRTPTSRRPGVDV